MYLLIKNLIQQVEKTQFSMAQPSDTGSKKFLLKTVCSSVLYICYCRGSWLLVSLHIIVQIFCVKKKMPQLFRGRGTWYQLGGHRRALNCLTYCAGAPRCLIALMITWLGTNLHQWLLYSTCAKAVARLLYLAVGKSCNVERLCSYM